MAPDSVSRIGIVTGERAPALSADGQALRAALQERGHAVDAVRWDDAAVDWARYDCLLVRSCWAYHEQADAFRDWIDAVDERDGLVVNPPAVLRWNMHKFYLQDLAQAGAPVAPTEFLETGAGTDLEGILDRTGWTDVVVKPAVGTSSAGVWRASTPVSTADATRFRSHLADTDLLVQRFRPEIREGELSVVFLDGAFSHAYRSRPAADDFRAHPNFDATVEPADPPQALVDDARDVVSIAGDVVSSSRDLALDDDAVSAAGESPFVYARVDGVARDDGFELLELELIEPHLGLAKGDGAVERFADAIEAALGRRASTPGEPHSPSEQSTPSDPRSLPKSSSSGEGGR